MTTFRTTLSAGYLRDLQQKSHLPARLYWTLNHTADSGIETWIDLGADNAMIPERWSFFLYQAFVTVPLFEGPADAPYRKPRIQIGRQLLTEGFELSPMDGVLIPLHFSGGSGVTLGAGALIQTDKAPASYESKTVTASAHASALGFRPEAGIIHKRRDSEGATFGHGSLSRGWESIPWSPFALARAQWNLGERSLDQAVAELATHPSDTFDWSVAGSTRQPSALAPGDQPFLYRLFSISTEECLESSAVWNPWEDARVGAEIRRMTFHSQAGFEVGSQQELWSTFDWLLGRWTPSLTHLSSYGGEVVQGGLRFERALGDHMELNAEVDSARISKVNGISGWAHHGRGGVGFRLGSRFFALVRAEVERNHLFEFDSRAVIYVSHFFY